MENFEDLEKTEEIDEGKPKNNQLNLRQARVGEPGKLGKTWGAFLEKENSATNFCFCWLLADYRWRRFANGHGCRLYLSLRKLPSENNYILTLNPRIKSKQYSKHSP